MQDNPALDALQQLALLVRTGEEPDEGVPELMVAIEQGADAALLPAMFGALEDEDPHGLLWPMFYIMEGMDEAYLEALVVALPGLDQRARRWAETAVLRIVNTRDDDEDCTPQFEAYARGANAQTRNAIKALLQRLAADADPGLSTAQRESLKLTLSAVEVV